MPYIPNTQISAGSGGGLFSAYALLRDEKAQNTDGGASTSGSWETRTLNTESFDVGGIVSLASNQFTLGAGTYWVAARAPSYDSKRSQARIQNITDGTTAITGAITFTDGANDTGGYTMQDSWVQGRITLSGTKVFELQQQVEHSVAGFGYGVAANFTTEVYSEVQIWKEA